jgi:hypothetical protein
VSRSADYLRSIRSTTKDMSIFRIRHIADYLELLELTLHGIASGKIVADNEVVFYNRESMIENAKDVLERGEDL